jgi:hypothetical protein
MTRQTFVGYHCSNTDITNFDGEISEDYFDRFEAILNLIKSKYKEAKNFLKRIKDDGIEYDSKLSYEINLFFNNIGLKWIFVDENDTLTRYGNKCYSVYFNSMDNVFALHDSNEENSDYSYIYFYFESNTPILKKI